MHIYIRVCVRVCVYRFKLAYNEQIDCNRLNVLKTGFGLN